MSSIYRNDEGYIDSTAGRAISKCCREEKEVEDRKNALIRVLKYIIVQSGFELIGRIQIRDKTTGKEYR